VSFLIRDFNKFCDEYKKYLKTCDDELYSICNKRKAINEKNISTKIMIVNGAYSAGLLRGTKESYVDITDHIINHKKEIKNILDFKKCPNPVTDYDKFLEVIIGRHYEFTLLLRKSVGKDSRSFVSKYMHFHNPYVPIYDGYVIKALTYKTFGVQLKKTKGLDLPIPRDEQYGDYCNRFYRLYRHLEKKGLSNLNVRTLDYYLWRIVKKSPVERAMTTK